MITVHRHHPQECIQVSSGVVPRQQKQAGRQEEKRNKEHSKEKKRKEKKRKKQKRDELISCPDRIERIEQ